MTIDHSNRTYGDLLTDIREGISVKRFKPQQMLPSEKVLASKYGISRWAVREALDLLSQERLISRIPGKGTVVTAQDRSLSTTEQVRLMVVIDATQDVGRNEYAVEMLRYLQLANAKLSQPFSLAYQFLDFSPGLDVLKQLEADIVVVMPFSQRCQSLLETCEQDQTPSLICLGRHLKNDAVTQVFIDHVAGTTRAVEHLLGVGHERILLVAPLSYPGGYSAIRQEAFCAAMQSAGCDDPQSFVEEVDLDYSMIQAAMSRRLSGDAAPTAIFVADGGWASPVLHALAVMSKRVPTDISLLTYDDLPDMRAFSPPITAIRQPLRETAYSLIGTLDMHARAGRVPQIRTAISPELILRDSCMPASSYLRTNACV